MGESKSVESKPSSNWLREARESASRFLATVPESLKATGTNADTIGTTSTGDDMPLKDYPLFTTDLDADTVTVRPLDTRYGSGVEIDIAGKDYPADGQCGWNLYLGPAEAELLIQKVKELIA